MSSHPTTTTATTPTFLSNRSTSLPAAQVPPSLFPSPNHKNIPGSVPLPSSRSTTHTTNTCASSRRHAQQFLPDRPLVSSPSSLSKATSSAKSSVVGFQSDDPSGTVPPHANDDDATTVTSINLFRHNTSYSEPKLLLSSNGKCSTPLLLGLLPTIVVFVISAGLGTLIVVWALTHRDEESAFSFAGKLVLDENRIIGGSHFYATTIRILLFSSIAVSCTYDIQLGKV